MFYFGLAFLFCSVFFGYLIIGGNIRVLFQPAEWMIIIGAAVGSYIIANSSVIIKDMLSQVKKIGRQSPYDKKSYINLLLFMYNFFQFSHSKGLMEVESQIEDINNSTLFSNFINISTDQAAVNFFCDYFRIISLGFDNVQELEYMMENDLNARRKQAQAVSQSLLRIADALPALGIVAAVLGVICAMASVGSDPAVLGPKIASALVGTFIGAFSSYGIVNPFAYRITRFKEEELRFLDCIKAAIIAHVSGYAPSISIEYARQTIPTVFKPDFFEIEAGISDINKIK